MNKIKVLIVDDSALVRLTMKKLLDSDSRIEVIGTANDPYQAVKEMKKKAPDVITLDIQMPKMDGITFLKKIIQQHPLPVVICSALTEKGSSLGIEALNLGAVEIITKPKVGTKQFFEESKISICDSIVAASRVSVAHLRAKGQMNQSSRTKSSTNLLPKVKLNSTKKIIAIGASTGGTDAIRTVLRNIPKESPGIVIVQHMPEFFTASFAKSVNKICKIEVKEANQGDAILPGTALIAPGNKHMKIKKVGQ
ncbi:MAG: chemotaxis-specific protein-glutamate methyltransferase CheB [Candidatus Cloacimonadota bacterium]|nr:chemotaxis-specific protein-glutamate methyltransferase CheB [Candidatus Cloacimonadota bacterium]